MNNEPGFIAQLRRLLCYILFCHGSTKKGLRLVVTAYLPGATVKGTNMDISTSISNEIPFALEPQDFAGNDATIDGMPMFTTDAGITVIPDPEFGDQADDEGKWHFIARADAGPQLGQPLLVLAHVDADLGEGVRQIDVEVMKVTWQSAEASAINVEVGDPRPRTDT